MIKELDQVIQGSLSGFVRDVFRIGWFGREREAVSLYAFGYLQRYCDPGHFLREATQIGIEVAVPQIQEPNRKRQVCKDLVIWAEPSMTCWNSDGEPARYPTAILEWKVNKASVSKYDTEWLCKFSVNLSEFVGYAICLDLLRRNFRLSCTRVHQGQACPEWLVL